MMWDLVKSMMVGLVALTTASGNSLESDIVTVPFPTALEEFERIQKTCEMKGIRSFQKANEMHRQCLLDSKIAPDDEDEGGIVGVTTVGKLNCDHLPERNSCWNSIIQIIEDCIPGRGKTVGKIYSQFQETTCKDEEELKRLRISSQLCPVQATISKSCKDHIFMTSPDLCTSFKSQKKCEESDLALCSHSEHKALVQKHFKEIGRSLGCASDEDADGVIKSSGSTLVPLPFILLITTLLI